MKIVKYSADNNILWDSFIDGSKNGLFMFKRDFMEYHSNRFIDNSLMFYDNEYNLIAVLPANIKEDVLYSHGGLTYGGFITNESMKQHKMLECFDALRQYLRENHIEKCIYKTIPHIYHKIPAEEDEYALFKNNAYILKQEPSTTILLSNPCKMPKGRKAQVSRARREGVIICESEDFETFITLENLILEEYHNTKAVHTAGELRLLKSRFPNQIQLWTAQYQNKMIASTLLFVYDDVVHTQYMSSNNVGREVGALDLLIKTLIDNYKDSKKYFDFGISTENQGKYLNEGLISQKEGFGGRTITYNTWEMNIK